MPNTASVPTISSNMNNNSTIDKNLHAASVCRLCAARNKFIAIMPATIERITAAICVMP